MKKILYIVCTFFMITILSYCDDSYKLQTVGINKIDNTGIYFTYYYLGKSYSGSFLLDAIEEDFYTSDSLIISINKNQPEKYEFISVVKTIWPVQEEIVSLKDNISNEDIVYGYHQVEKKPLFKGANDEYENDTAIFNYFKKKYSFSLNYHLIRVSVLINDNGEVKLQKAYTQIDDESRFVEKLIDEMPNFSPPIHDGKRVSVSYLIDVPVFK